VFHEDLESVKAPLLYTNPYWNGSDSLAYNTPFVMFISWFLS